MSSATTLTISRPTYAQCARDRGPSPPASTASDRRVSRGRTASTWASRRDDGDGCRDRDARARRLDSEARDDNGGQRELAAVERTKDQAADAKSDLQRDTRRPELQRGLDEGDRHHHAQPDEHRGNSDGRRLHARLAAYDSSRASTATWLPSRSRAAVTSVTGPRAAACPQLGQRRGPLPVLEFCGVARGEFVEPRGLV